MNIDLDLKFVSKTLTLRYLLLKVLDVALYGFFLGGGGGGGVTSRVLCFPFHVMSVALSPQSFVAPVFRYLIPALTPV